MAFGNEEGQMYSQIRNTVISAQSKVAAVVNSAMVRAYWEIGGQIYMACDRNDRAEYGKNLLKYLSEGLIREFGKGFTERNLRNMRQFNQLEPKFEYETIIKDPYILEFLNKERYFGYKRKFVCLVKE